MAFAKEVSDFLAAFKTVSDVMGTPASREGERLDNEYRRASTEHMRWDMGKEERDRQELLGFGGLLDQPGIYGDSGGGTAVSGDVASRADHAMNFFMGKGLSVAQASGLTGNLIAESNLNPTIIGDGGMSHGIMQANGDRLTNLKQFGGDQWQNFDTQLAFVLHELGTTEGSAGRRLASARTPEEAAAAAIGYERPRGWSADDPTKGHNWSGRLNYTRGLYNKYAGASPAGKVAALAGEELSLGPQEAASSDTNIGIADKYPNTYDPDNYGAIPGKVEHGEGLNYLNIYTPSNVGAGLSAGSVGAIPEATGPISLAPEPTRSMTSEPSGALTDEPAPVPTEEEPIGPGGVTVGDRIITSSGGPAWSVGYASNNGKTMFLVQKEGEPGRIMPLSEEWLNIILKGGGKIEKAGATTDTATPDSGTMSESDTADAMTFFDDSSLPYNVPQPGDPNDPLDTKAPDYIRWKKEHRTVNVEGPLPGGPMGVEVPAGEEEVTPGTAPASEEGAIPEKVATPAKRTRHKPGFDPLPQTSGHMDRVSQSGHESLDPGSQQFADSARRIPHKFIMGRVFKFASKAYGFDEEAIATTNPDDDPRLAAHLSGHGAAPVDLVDAVEDKIDPEHKMTDDARHIAAINRIWRFYHLKGDDNKADAAAYALMQTYKTIAHKWGAIAQKELSDGDLDAAVESYVKAYSTVPDGDTMDAVKNDDGTYSVTITNEKGEVHTESVLTPDQIMEHIMNIGPGDFDALILHNLTGEETTPKDNGDMKWLQTNVPGLTSDTSGTGSTGETAAPAPAMATPPGGTPNELSGGPGTDVIEGDSGKGIPETASAPATTEVQQPLPPVEPPMPFNEFLQKVTKAPGATTERVNSALAIWAKQNEQYLAYRKTLPTPEDKVSLEAQRKLFQQMNEVGPTEDINLNEDILNGVTDDKVRNAILAAARLHNTTAAAMREEPRKVAEEARQVAEEERQIAGEGRAVAAEERTKQGVRTTAAGVAKDQESAQIRDSIMQGFHYDPELGVETPADQEGARPWAEMQGEERGGLSPIGVTGDMPEPQQLIPSPLDHPDYNSMTTADKKTVYETWLAANKHIEDGNKDKFVPVETPKYNEQEIADYTTAVENNVGTINAGANADNPTVLLLAAGIQKYQLTDEIAAAAHAIANTKGSAGMDPTQAVDFVTNMLTVQARDPRHQFYTAEPVENQPGVVRVKMQGGYGAMGGDEAYMPLAVYNRIDHARATMAADHYNDLYVKHLDMQQIGALHQKAVLSGKAAVQKAADPTEYPPVGLGGIYENPDDPALQMHY